MSPSKRKPRSRTSRATQKWRVPTGQAARASAVVQPAARPLAQSFAGWLACHAAQLLVAGLYLLTRVPRLALTGLNYDEPTYLYWGQVIGADWSRRYIGAGWGGKQPLHSWLIALSERLLPDPIFAARLVSVVAGALALAALWLLAKRLFSPRVALLAALLYIICPFTLLFDRQALIDSLLAAEALWLVYFSVRLVDSQDAVGVMGLVLAFGAGLLTKSVAQAFPLLLPASLLAAAPGELDRRRVGRWLAAVGGSLAGGLLLYYVAFGAADASRAIGQFEQQYGRYAMSLRELLGFPWPKWSANAASVVRWFGQLATAPLSLAAVAALLTLPWLGRRAWLLGAWGILPIAGQVLIASVFYNRYILFSIPPLLMLIARLLEWGYERLSSSTAVARRSIAGRSPTPALGVGACALLLLLPLRQDLALLTDLEAANRAVGGFSGLQGMRDYLAARADAGPTTVVVNYSPAPVEDGTAALLRGMHNVTVLRVAPMEGKLAIFDPATGQSYPRSGFKEKEVHYASFGGAEKDSWLAGRIELVQRFPNVRGDDTYVGLYRIRFDDSFR